MKKRRKVFKNIKDVFKRLIQISKIMEIVKIKNKFKNPKNGRWLEESIYGIEVNRNNLRKEIEIDCIVNLKDFIETGKTSGIIRKFTRIDKYDLVKTKLF